MTAESTATVGSAPTIDDLSGPLFIAWQITSICNMGCHHCCEESGQLMPNEMNKEQVMEFCRQVVDIGVPYAAISGGEPMLHPQFFEVCEYFRSNDIALKVETNGEFVDAAAAKRFADLDLRSVQISVDGATAETHEKLRVDGRWSDAIQAIENLTAAGVRVEMVFVPTRFNIHETADVIDRAASLGVYGLYTGKLMRIGRAAKNWDMLCPSDVEYEGFFKVLDEKVAQYQDPGIMKVYYYPFDVIEELRVRVKTPSASLLVIPDGRVKLIGPLPFVCGNVTEQPLAEIWERYRQGWREKQVVEFVDKVLEDPTLVRQANDWIELY